MKGSGKRSLVGRFLDLPARERRLLAEAWLLLAVNAIRIRFRPASTLASALVPAETGAARSRDETRAELALALARAAAHHVVAMTCLPRALTLRAMLAARGVASVLRIGVRRRDGAIEAHAWIEVDGAAVGEPEAVERRFLPLVTPRA
jgi:hypothetical protein